MGVGYHADETACCFLLLYNLADTRVGIRNVRQDIIHPHFVFLFQFFLCKLKTLRAHIRKATVVTFPNIVLQRHDLTGTEQLQFQTPERIAQGFQTLDHSIIVVQYKTGVFQHNFTSFAMIIANAGKGGNHKITVAIIERMCYNKNKRSEVCKVERTMYPVDVISVCNADGEIRPLRLRLEKGGQEFVRIDIAEVLKVTEVAHVGVEARIFLCRARPYGRDMLFELKYTFRSHSWTLLRRIS